MKSRLTTEGNETVTNCERLEMLAPVGKYHFVFAVYPKNVPVIAFLFFNL
jgi:hypothetical protein